MGKEPRAGKICIDGIQILQFRGYDSCGITTIDETGKFVTTKMASDSHYGGDCINRIKTEAKQRHDHRIGLGHTRWATHGSKTDVNAHPHHDDRGRIAVVHSGILSNFKELKEEMITKLGITPKSETDTELVAQLTGYYMDQGYSTKEAFEKCLERLEGSFALAMVSTETPDKLYFAKNAGPLHVGLCDDMIIASSDVSVFSNYTKKYITVEDNEVTVMSLN